MKMTQRLLAVLLTLCMVVALVPTMVFASSAVAVAPIGFASITAQLGEVAEITIPLVANGTIEVDSDEGTTFLIKFDKAFTFKTAVSPDGDAFGMNDNFDMSVTGSARTGYSVKAVDYVGGTYDNEVIGLVTFTIADTAAAGTYDFTIDGEVVGQVTLTPAASYDEMTVAIRSDKTELEPGDEFTLTYKVYAIPETGMSDYEFFLVCDNDVFEYVGGSVPSTIEGYTCYGTASDSQQMLCGTIGAEKFYGNTVLGTATLKVKDTAASGDYTFDLLHIEADKNDPAWLANPTSFGYSTESAPVIYPFPAVDTLTVSVKGEEPVEPTVYTVKYVVEGKVVFEDTFEEGENEPAYTETPVKEADDTFTYEFAGWKKTTEGNAIIYAAEFTATEIPAPTVYTVKYVVEGEVVFTADFEEGTTEPTYTETPTKAEDETYTYEFKEWTKTEEGTVITYTAVFTATEKPVEPPVEPTVYTVKYVVEGEVVFTADFEEGTTEPTYTETPAKKATAQYTYTFIGWNKTVEGEVITYTAEFGVSVNKYAVTFKDGDEVLATIDYEYGATIDYVAPEKLPTAEYTYTFEKFEPALEVVTGEATYQVVYTATEIPPVEPEAGKISFAPITAQLGEVEEVVVPFVANGKIAPETEFAVSFNNAAFTFKSAVSPDGDAFDETDNFEITLGGNPRNGFKVLVKDWVGGEYADFEVGSAILTVSDTATAGTYEFTVDGEVIGTIELIPAVSYDEMTVAIRSDKTELEPGDEFTLTYKVYNIPETGMSDYEFFLVCNTDAFEYLGGSVPSAIEGYTCYGTASDGEMMLCGTIGADKFYGNTVLGTAVLKVKDTAVAGDYTFDLLCIEHNPSDPAWLEHPTSFGYSTETAPVIYPFPAVDTLTVSVKGEEPVEPTVYTVKYVVEGEVVFTADFEEGTTEPKYTETPTKAEDDTYTYEFAGWDKKVEETTITYTAVFTATEKAGAMEGKIVILHTNDVHGAVEGYAYIAALKAEFEAQGATVILADAGDYSQGTTYVSTTKGADAIAMMNAAGYDIATLGNHEFDYGYPQLAENLKAAGFTVVCADVIDNETGDPIFGKGHVIIEKDGVKIGFFGLETPEAQTKANPALIQGLTFLAGTDLTTCVEKEIEALKAEGADLVIALAHLGVDEESDPYRSTDIYAKVTGLDFMIDGHSHTVMTEGPNGEKIQSTGTAFANIGVVVIDAATKTIVSNYLIPVAEDSLKDETVAAEAQKIVDRVNAEYGKVFAQSKVDLNGDKAPNGNRDSETNNGDMITDAMIWALTEQNPGSIDGVDADNIVAITNGGGIRAWIHKGPVTKNDVLTVLPFGNTLSVVYVTGAELLEALEASTYCTPTSVGGFPQIAGMNIEINTSAAYDPQDETYPASTYYGPKTINRVTILDVNGKAFDPEATYAVITNNFCAAGGDTYYAFAAATSQFDTGRTLDTVVMDYITEKLEGVIGEQYADPQGRIVLKSDEPVEPTVYTVRYVVEGEVVFEETFEEGANEPTYTETPTKAEDETYTYEFKEWTKTVKETLITYTAEFTATEKQVEPPVEPKTITVNWIVEGETVYTATYTEGEDEPAYVGETPTKKADDKFTYTFDKWEKTTEGDSVVNYVAAFKATPKTGDVYNTVLWAILLVSCAAVVAVATVAKKKIED